MEFLRRILSQIKTQLVGLTISQRLVIGLLLVIMAGAVLMMVSYASDRETVALLNQSFSQKNLQTIVNQLEMWGEKYRVQGDQVWIPKSSHKRLIARLGYAEALPQDTSVGWNLLLEDTNIWVPETSRKDRKQIALQGELARAISSWPGVQKVKVFINTGDKRRLSNQEPRASASVAIKTSGQGGSRKLAISVAEFVSAANNRMKRENVAVNINGRSVPVSSEDDEFDSDYISQKMQYEELYVNKIRTALPPGFDAIVQVDVKWKNIKSEVHKKEILQEDEGSWNPVIEEEGRNDESQDQNVSQEPGLVANTGETENSSGLTHSNSTEESSTRKKPIAGHKETFEKIGMGGVKDVTASVMIPDEYFKGMAQQGSDQEPDAASIQTVIDRELPKLKRNIMLAIGLDSTQEDRVVVNSYWAGGVVASNEKNAGEQDETSTGSVTGMAVRYGKHIAVSALAMISLVMVLMMVRKSIGPVEVSEEEAIVMMAGKKPLDALGLEDSHLDDGEDGDALLSGMEMDEETIRSQQVLQQIREMVTDLPEDATNLVSKWIDQEN